MQQMKMEVSFKSRPINSITSKRVQSSLHSAGIGKQELRYNITMNNIKPTVREIRTILASHNLTLPRNCFNDKHVNGGRIKLWGKTYDLAEMQYLEQFLTVLFPKLDVEVYEWKGSCTCIKWTNDVQEPRYNSSMGTKITHEEYQKMWYALNDGIITEQEWRVFCDALFDQTLEENKDVMVRLKNR